MQRIANGVAYIALMALSLSGCGTLKSDFNYAGDATETVALVVAEPLRVRSLDGRSVSLPMMLQYPYTVTLSAGPHTLAFQYGETWGRGQSNELVRSPVMELNFDARSGESYQLEFQRPDDVSNHDLAEDYIAGFSAWLVDAQGQKIAARSTDNLGGIGRKLASIASKSELATAKPAAAQVQAPAESTSEASTRLQMMRQLWESASDDEKKSFMQWVVAPGS